MTTETAGIAAERTWMPMGNAPTELLRAPTMEMPLEKLYRFIL